MNLSLYIHNNLLHLKVIPNSSRNELKEENGQLKLYLHAVPEKDQANKELIKFFKKELGLKVLLKSGARSREKLLEIKKDL